MTPPASRDTPLSHKWPVAARWAMVTATTAAALTLTLGACSSDPADAVPARVSISTSSTSTASAVVVPSDSPSATPPVDPRQTKVAAANTKLTTSLFSVVETLKKLQTDNTLSDLRRKLGASTTSAREAIKRERSAAYPSSTRNCMTVRSNAAQATTRAAEGYAVRRLITSRISLLNKDLTALRAATMQVQADRVVLAAAIKGYANPPSTVAPSDVTAALADAEKRRASAVDAIKAVTGANADAGSSLDKVVSQSRAIVADACI